MYLSGEVERQRVFLREVDDATRVTKISYLFRIVLSKQI
jgi:hypothetical protein